MGKKYNDPRNKNQLYKQYGNNCFFEVLSPTADFKMFTIHFVRFDEKTKKIVEEIYNYISFTKMLVLLRYIDNDSITRKSEQYKKEGKDTVIWRYQGGTPARGDNPPIGRVFSIIPSKRINGVVFKAEEGTGEVEGKGLIKLLYNKGVKRILVPVPYEDLYGMAAYVKMRFEAYTIDMQLKGYYGSLESESQTDTSAVPETAAETPEEKPEFKQAVAENPEETPEEMWENMSFIY